MCIVYPLLCVSYLVLGNGLLPGLEPSDTGDRRPGIGDRVSGDRESDVYWVFQNFGSCVCVFLYQCMSAVLVVPV